MKVDNLLEHISRSYQIDLRGFAGDQPGFEKVLRAQLKKRASADDPESVETDTREGVASAKEELAPADLEQLIANLRTQLDNMGPVNLEAVHEYRRTRGALQVPRSAKHRSYEFPARAARRDRAHQFHNTETICRHL